MALSRQLLVLIAAAVCCLCRWAVVSTVVGPDITPIDVNLTKLGGSAVLQCLTNGNVTLNWFRNQVDGTLVDGKKYQINSINNTLTVLNVVAGDVGIYYCQAGTTNRSVALNIQPIVTTLPKSKNLVEGDDLSLNCQPVAFPPATVTWTRTNLKTLEVVNINTDSDTRSVVTSTTTQTNGSLTFDDMTIDDYMYYSCVADNVLGTGNATTLVRVKDNLAPLWPFIGICIEVVLLVLVIVIYEKRKSKQVEEDERKDESAATLTNSTDHRGKDDVRCRK